MDLEKEFELLAEFMKVYVQLLPYVIECGGMRIRLFQLPTLEHYKQNREWFLSPGFKDSVMVYENNRMIKNSCAGLGVEDGIAYRFYKYWIGCRFYTGGNITGQFTIVPGALHKILNSVYADPIRQSIKSGSGSQTMMITGTHIKQETAGRKLTKIKGWPHRVLMKILKKNQKIFRLGNTDYFTDK